jgi:tRNA U54 and U55 pseudouridine synthase Pus10
LIDNTEPDHIGDTNKKVTAVKWLIEQIKSNIFCDHIQGVEYWDKDTLIEFLEQAKAMEEEYKANIRKAIADYMYSEGCSCCEGKDHKDHAEKIAKLLDVPKYEDGSGYNFSQFRSN